VHDAANMLRRYLNYLPEPVITHNLYQPFRNVVSTDLSEQEKVAQFQALIEQLPERHQYLLFYLLDLLSLFSQNVQITKMDTFNLASVFTPGILLNPEHAMNPAQYKTSQKVVQFLVEHQHCFKMPQSSWFTVLNQEKGHATPTEKEETEKTKDTTSPPTSTTSSAPTAHRHNSQPTHFNTINTINTFTTTTTTSNPRKSSSSYPYHTQQKSLDLSNQDIMRPLSDVQIPHKEQRVKRAKTMPTRTSRYGPNDPLQIVQLNKSVIETDPNKNN
jgi:hypothetical protein